MMTTADLRSQILKDIADLRSGKLSRSEARAIAAMTRNVIDTVKIEISAASMKLTRMEAVEIGLSTDEKPDFRKAA